MRRWLCAWLGHKPGGMSRLTGVRFEDGCYEKEVRCGRCGGFYPEPYDPEDIRGWWWATDLPTPHPQTGETRIYSRSRLSPPKPEA